MLSYLRRALRSGRRRAYATKVAEYLLKEGFDPRLLKDTGPSTTFEPTSRLFDVPMSRRLSPCDAAQAIWLATNLFRARRFMAEAGGWPLASEHLVQAGCNRSEAYFLELLNEAVCQFQRSQAS